MSHSDRNTLIADFLKDAGWDGAARLSVPGDASTRSYERLTKDGNKAVLMNAPKGAEAPSEPDGATVEERQALGYNAVARLAGPNPEGFICLAHELTTRGFSAPRILAADLDAGLILLEDLGDDLFARVIENDPAQERLLYDAAIDTLAAIYRSSFPRVMQYRNAKWRVRDYDNAALQAETDLYLDWYIADLRCDIQAGMREEWYAVWDAAFEHLKAHSPGLALRDFHAENLFWLPERQATARVGLIDFQDGLFAHPAYDLVSLLEDARRDVSPEMIDELIDRFCSKAGLRDTAAFKRAYAVLGAQRNAKILGIFVRLAKRDGKPHYRNLLPRVQAHFKNNLAEPELGALKSWVQAYAPEALI